MAKPTGEADDPSETFTDASASRDRTQEGVTCPAHTEQRHDSGQCPAMTIIRPNRRGAKEEGVGLLEINTGHECRMGRENNI